MSNLHFLAYFDFFGYGNRVKDLPLEKELEFQAGVCKGKEIFTDKSGNKIPCHSYHFSDTQLFYTDDGDDEFMRIVQVAMRFIVFVSIQ